MGAIVETAVVKGLAWLIGLFVLLPAALMFFAWLIYIAVMVIRELRRRP